MDDPAHGGPSRGAAGAATHYRYDVFRGTFPTMGKLKWPFAAASAALLIAGVILGPIIFWRYGDGEKILLGLLVGGLASVVLYAVMRAIADSLKH